MSLFVTSPYQVVGDTVISQAVWSNLDNLVALTSFSIDDNEKEINQVVFSNNEGEIFSNFDINHEYDANVMQWHPSERVLAIGWGDGMLSTWYVDGKSRPMVSYTNTTQHHSAITVLKWNPSGKRLVTGDKKGIVCVWGVDNRGILNLMRQYKRKGEITQLVFCTLPPRIDLNAVNAMAQVSTKATTNDLLKIQNHTPSFFFGTDRGTLAYADDMGNCTDIQTLSSAVETLLFFSESSYLLLITRSLLLITYHINPDGKINKVNSVKLSIQNPDIAQTGFGGVVWIAPGVFAMATEEKLLRIYDVVLSEGYNLSLSAALGSDAERNDRVTAVAFDSLHRYIAIGTQVGWIVVYKYCGAIRDVSSGSQTPASSTSASDWEVMFKAPFNSPVTQLAFHTARGYLSVITEDQALFLTESTLHSFVYGDMALIQMNSNELYVQIGMKPNNTQGGAGGNKSGRSNDDGNTQLVVNTGMQLRGTAMTYTAFIVWTNKIAKVYRVDLSTSTITPLDPIKLSCSICAIADTTYIVEEVVFAIEQPGGSTVKIMNFNGVSRGSITFTDQEGIPICMDIQNKFLAIITNKGCIKVFDIHTPTKAKLLGSAGTFHTDMQLNYLKANQMLSNPSPSLTSGSSKSGKGANSNAALALLKLSDINAPSTPNNSIQIRQIRVNSSGTMIAILVDRIEGAQAINYPDPTLYLYDRNKGTVLTFSFQPMKRYPISIYWDNNDERLLCCEAQKIRDKGAVSTTTPASSPVPPVNGSGTDGAAQSEQTNLDGNANPTNSVGNGSSKTINTTVQQEDSRAVVEVYILFATAEKGLLMQDSFPLTSPIGQLIGFSVPSLYFKHESHFKQDDDDNDNGGPSKTSEGVDDTPTNIVFNNDRLVVKLMRDFAGITDITDSLRTILLDFSYYMTLGKLDEAYRVIKDVNSVHIWENMAQMCVKTRRLDVAEVCLSHMGNLRGLEIVKDYRKRLLNENIYLDNYLNTSPNSTNANNSLSGGSVTTINAPVSTATLVVIGVLAIQLGLLDDAVAIFKEAKRFDLLNKLYQDAGVWKKAIKVAENYDRMHLKTTYYNYARYLEFNNHITDAIEYYKLAEVDHVEVPRMLFYLNRIDELNDYIIQSDNSALLKWWAAYLESIDRIDKAKKYYAKSKDYLSLVRIACFKGDFEGAAAVITDSNNDRASSYHFARQLEHQNEFQEAINFYALSGCYHHCIRLAKEHGLDGELMRYALKSTPAYMISCAEYYEQKGEYDKAIQLYYKGKDIAYALELCFRIGEEIQQQQQNAGGRKVPVHPYAAAAYDMINTIAQELGVNSSPQLLARCADFLVSNKQYAKAIELYILAKKHYNAIEICIQYKIPLNDDIINQLTPTEEQINDINERKDILKQIGKLLKKQGLFIQASKKFTQAGDRIQAMKCLIKHGDNKLVIQFANISRNRDIYILAANYLQQMNWREDIEVMKCIILFYNKAKAYIQLSNFYEHCAAVEIDDYQDYTKALSAYNEALKYLNKMLNEIHTTNTITYTENDIHLAQQMASIYESRMMKINKFLEAKQSMANNGTTLITICEALLQDPEIDEAVRLGDVFAMLIEYNVQRRQYREAYDYLQEMQNRKVNVGHYLDQAVIEEVFKGAGVSRGGNMNFAAPTATTSTTTASAAGGSGSGSGGGSSSSRMEGKEDNEGIKMFNNNTAAPPDRDEEGEDVDEEIGEEVEEEVEEERKMPTGSSRNGGSYNPKGYNSYRK